MVSSSLESKTHIAAELGAYYSSLDLDAFRAGSGEAESCPADRFEVVPSLIIVLNQRAWKWRYGLGCIENLLNCRRFIGFFAEFGFSARTIHALIGECVKGFFRLPPWSHVRSFCTWVKTSPSAYVSVRCLVFLVLFSWTSYYHFTSVFQND